MTLNNSSPSLFDSLDSKLMHYLGIVEQMQDYLLQNRPAAIAPIMYQGINQLSLGLPKIIKGVKTLEDERSGLQALAEIGQYVNSSLELETVLQIVMDTIIRLTNAERGFLMLRNDQRILQIDIARNWEQESLEPSEFAISHTVVNRVAEEGQPLLTTNAQEDPRLTGQESIVAYNLRSILCVPLKIREEVIGVIYTDNRIRSGIFTHKERDLLAAFANQAAFAIANARLFDSVKQTLAEVTELKNLMDNVFASVASGVLTADIEERIMMCNHAAEVILGRASEEIIGRGLGEIFLPLSPVLEPHLERVMQRGELVVGLETTTNLPERGRVDISLSLSPLKDIQRTTHGVAIVLEDLTEKKRLQAQRKLFERMVSPAVINQLDPNSLQLGGRRVEITTLFADIRGFTSYSEQVEPEELVKTLNDYLAAAAEAILNEVGTVDKFLGDAVMAWFNAPIPQPDHTLRAVRSALAIRDAVTSLHQRSQSGFQFSFGIGVHVGDAVLGLIGTQSRMEYTAIGDSVNTAKRIQENAKAGQILLSQEAYEKVREAVRVEQGEPIHAKGKRQPIVVYQLLGLRA